jgi:hypothetical protein
MSVGGALRRNPFPPLIPCHRVVASDLTIGGFFGEANPDKAKSKKNKVSGVSENEGKMVARKIVMLKREGVKFEGKKISQSCLWDGKKAAQTGEAANETTESIEVD